MFTWLFGGAIPDLVYPISGIAFIIALRLASSAVAARLHRKSAPAAVAVEPSRGTLIARDGRRA